MALLGSLLQGLTMKGNPCDFIRRFLLSSLRLLAEFISLLLQGRDFPPIAGDHP